MQLERKQHNAMLLSEGGGMSREIVVAMRTEHQTRLKDVAFKVQILEQATFEP
jgi:protein involved in sex pheromone biosynthesis